MSENQNEMNAGGARVERGPLWRVLTKGQGIAYAALTAVTKTAT